MLIQIKNEISSEDIQIEEKIILATSILNEGKSVHLEIKNLPNGEIISEYVVTVSSKQVYRGTSLSKTIKHYNKY